MLLFFIGINFLDWRKYFPPVYISFSRWEAGVSSPCIWLKFCHMMVQKVGILTNKIFPQISIFATPVGNLFCFVKKLFFKVLPAGVKNNSILWICFVCLCQNLQLFVPCDTILVLCYWGIIKKFEGDNSNNFLAEKIFAFFVQHDGILTS